MLLLKNGCVNVIKILVIVLNDVNNIKLQIEIDQMNLLMVKRLLIISFVKKYVL